MTLAFSFSSAVSLHARSLRIELEAPGADVPAALFEVRCYASVNP